jgi:hypothetical protein
MKHLNLHSAGLGYYKTHGAIADILLLTSYFFSLINYVSFNSVATRYSNQQ